MPDYYKYAKGVIAGNQAALDAAQKARREATAPTYESALKLAQDWRVPYMGMTQARANTEQGALARSGMLGTGTAMRAARDRLRDYGQQVAMNQAQASSNLAQLAQQQWANQSQDWAEQQRIWDMNYSLRTGKMGLQAQQPQSNPWSEVASLAGATLGNYLGGEKGSQIISGWTDKLTGRGNNRASALAAVPYNDYESSLTQGSGYAGSPSYSGNGIAAGGIQRRWW